MFDIGWGELVVIGIIALIVIGPKELPTVLRTLGQTMAKIKRMANEFQGQFQEALREAEIADLKKHAEDITGDLNKSVGDFSSFDPMAQTQKEIEHALEAPAEAKPDSSASTPAAENAEPAAAAEAPAPAAIALEPPKAPAPVAGEDFAATEPPRKPAGGSA